MLYATRYVKEKDGSFSAVHRHLKERNEFTDAELLAEMYREDMKALQAVGIKTDDYYFKEWMTHRSLMGINQVLEEIRSELEYSNVDDDEKGAVCDECEKPVDECDCADGFCSKCENPSDECTCEEEEVDKK
jgi:hypothetical protein